jgi:hypothetical protein
MTLDEAVATFKRELRDVWWSVSERCVSRHRIAGRIGSGTLDCRCIAMKVELRITEDDYAKAAQFHEWPQVLRWPSAVILILLVLAVIFATWWLPPDAAHIVRVLAILWAVLAAVLMHVLVPYPPPPDVPAIQTYPGAKSLELGLMRGCDSVPWATKSCHGG